MVWSYLQVFTDVYILAAILVVALILYYVFKAAKVPSSRRNDNRNFAVKIVALNIYPIKSCAGIPLKTQKIGTFGFENDRRWMIVNSESKRFVTIRQHPKMCLITPTIDEKSKTLIVNAPGMETLKIPLEGFNKTGPILDVGIWKDTCRAVDEGDLPANWFTKYLGENVRLVRTPDDLIRVCGEKFRVAGENNITGYADGFPFLVTSEASLAEVNDMVGKGKDFLTMKRFRPNIVVSGVSEREEDTWKTLKINNLKFWAVKPCSRCKITTVIPEKGEFGGEEPLATIKAKRSGTFGQNLTHSKQAIGSFLSVGDGIEIIETKPTHHTESKNKDD